MEKASSSRGRTPAYPSSGLGSRQSDSGPGAAAYDGTGGGSRSNAPATKRLGGSSQSDTGTGAAAYTGSDMPIKRRTISTPKL